METSLLTPDLNGEGLRIGIVQARFNEPLCRALSAACVQELLHLGVASNDILLITVPGALEIPFALQQLAQTESFDALIAIGVVIRGETYHFEIVANESAAGVTRVTLEHDIPVANAILTTENEAQAEIRAAEKGADAARVAVEMANLELALLEGAEDDEMDEDEA
ncbi:MAG: 6,7-dimethyl-8-ribityllumazine synthase [Burkholderiaceae bacterium]|nr:MAG: 6,7-dimethyl-8-ribityllumazine synthase [Burkholderiaceae bacterium]